MRLALLLDRRYAPYQKWLGTAFAGIAGIGDLHASLATVVSATDPRTRESALAAAYVMLADRHNATGVAAEVPATTSPYHSRPAQVLMADRFTQACLETVHDEQLLSLPLIGAVDQHIDSTDVLGEPRLFRSTAVLYS